MSLPKREFMENAKEIWEDMGLPALTPAAAVVRVRSWASGTTDLEVMARRAVRSEYWDTGKIIAQRRRNDLPMNTEVRTLDEGTIGRMGETGDKKEGDLTWDGLKDASRIVTGAAQGIGAAFARKHGRRRRARSSSRTLIPARQGGRAKSTRQAPRRHQIQTDVSDPRVAARRWSRNAVDTLRQARCAGQQRGDLHRGRA